MSKNIKSHFAQRMRGFRNVISMENIAELFKFRENEYDSETAYNYFCDEPENMLCYICGVKDNLDSVGVTNSEVKTMLRSVIIASSHIIFLRNYFDESK